MTASIIRFVLQLQLQKRLTRCSPRGQPSRGFTCYHERNTIHFGREWEQYRVTHLFKFDRKHPARMKTLAVTITGLMLLVPGPAGAIVGGGVPSAEGIGRSVVTIVGSRGNFCSGVLMASKLVLTAAHCVQPGAVYKIVEYGADRKTKLQDVRTVVIHPAFNMQAIMAHRASADVALLQLEAQPEGTNAAIIAAPQLPIVVGSRFTIAGIGVTVRGEGKSGGLVRAAGLVATGRPGTLQIRLVDPVGQGTRDGLGACTGDSGGPVFEDRASGAVVIGVISWSTGPNDGAGCGGLTGVTPLTLYRDWILQTARAWGSAL
jgi:Trypsin